MVPPFPQLKGAVEIGTSWPPDGMLCGTIESKMFYQTNIFDKRLKTLESKKEDKIFKGEKDKIINMDVKFPLAHYEKFVETKDKLVMDNEKKDFLKDVKNHIKTISKGNFFLI